jgi:hypothetical protein
MPIVFRSTPAIVNHAWSVPPVNGRGSPEAKPKRSIAAMRRDVKILMYEMVLICFWFLVSGFWLSETDLFLSNPFLYVLHIVLGSADSYQLRAFIALCPMLPFTVLFLSIL